VAQADSYNRLMVFGWRIFFLTGSQDQPDETRRKILYIQATGLFRPIGRYSEAREISKDNLSFCPFTILANWPKAGTRAIFQARVDVVVFLSNGKGAGGTMNRMAGKRVTGFQNPVNPVILSKA
jgi:hypothetical protein